MCTLISVVKCIFNSIFNYQLEPNVQLVIQQFIEQPTRAQCTSCYSAVYLITSQSMPAVYSAVCSIASQSTMYSWLICSILNYQPENNLQQVIQQYAQLPTRALFSSGYSADFELPYRVQCTVGYSAVCSITSQSSMYSWLFSSIFNEMPEPNAQRVIQQYVQVTARP